MRVAVLTPYYEEPLPVLERCRDSVVAQTHPCTHFFIADGRPQAEVDGWDVQHIKLARNHNDWGSTPRSVGGISALNQGYQAFAFLDGDNFFDPEHVESLVALCRTEDCQVAFSQRALRFTDGEPFESDEGEGPGGRHADTNTWLITAKAAYLLPLWAMMDQSLSVSADTVMFRLARELGFKLGWTGRKTVHYVSKSAFHYRRLGRPIPDYAVEKSPVGSRFDAQRMYERTRLRMRWKAP